MNFLSTEQMQFQKKEDFFLADVASPENVCSRIESLVRDFFFNLNSPKPFITPFWIVNRSAKNSEICEEIGENQKIVIKLNLSDKQLIGKKGKRVKSFIRVWKVLELSYRLVSTKRQATQREAFYHLLSDSSLLFPNQRHLNEAIQDVVGILGCSRSSLGFYASSRGTVVGKLYIKEGEFGPIIDCEKLGLGGMSISGNFNVLENYEFSTNAEFIVVVEKDAIFQRLSEDRFFEMVPSILITAKGFPDLATRVFLHKLHQKFPEIPIVGLVDWNPFGFAIISSYKFGSVRMGLESPKYVCDVKWLGVRSNDLKYIPEEGFQDLTPKDLVLLHNMMESKMLERFPKYKAELLYMLEFGKKAEIEAFYSNGYGFLAEYISQKIVANEYI